MNKRITSHLKNSLLKPGKYLAISMLTLLLFFILPFTTDAQLPWTANFESTAGNNNWTTGGSLPGNGSLALNDCYNGNSANVYWMTRSATNKCAGNYTGANNYCTALSGNGSCNLYSVFKIGGLVYLENYYGFTNTSTTMYVVSPVITNAAANCQLDFIYTLNPLGNSTCTVAFSTNGGTSWTQIGSNLTTSISTNSFSSSFSPGGSNFQLKFEFDCGTSSGAGSTFEFDNVNVTTAACVAPAAQPTGLSFSNIHANSIDGSFTASSPAADGYLVIRTTSSTAPTNPVNGTVYAPGSSALGGVIVQSGPSTSFTASGLSSATQYWFWIYSMSTFCYSSEPMYKTASPLSGNATTISGKSWNGVGVSGGTGGTDFNTAANWIGGLPGATDEALIVTDQSINATITLSSSITIGSLNILNNIPNANTLALDVTSKTLTINNTIDADVYTSTGAMTVVSLRVGTGSIIVNGATRIGTNGNLAGAVEFVGSGGASSTGTVTFKGDVTFGDTYAPTTGNSIGTFYFDAPGAQNIITNNTNNIPLNGNVQIGNTNSPTVTLSTAYSGQMQAANAGNNLTINAGATLNLSTATWNQNNASGTFTNNGTLSLGGSSGGQTGSNFPLNFSTVTMSAASTTIYDSNNGVNQTVYGTTYGNLTLTNGSGAGATTKTAGAALTVAGNLLINPNVTYAGSTFTTSVKGNWTNNGTFTANTSTINFNGAAAQQILGSSATTFHNFTINNAAGLTLSPNAGLITTVTNTATLTSGKITLGAFNFEIGVSGTKGGLAGGSASSYFVTNSTGVLKYYNVGTGGGMLNPAVYPVGYSTSSYEPITLTPGSATADNYSARVGQHVLASGTSGAAFANNVVDWSWTVTSQLNNGTIANSLTPTWNGADELTNFDRTNASLSYYNAGWISLTPTGKASTGADPYTLPVTALGTTLPLGGISTSGTVFAVGSNGVLPIELVGFDANLQKDQVVLNWTTSTETNNDYFTIEKSNDGIAYSLVGIQKGAGNSSEYLHYTMIDPKPFEGTSYYRLSQTDFNGKSKTFNPVAINRKNTGSFEVFPNPSDGQNLFVKLSGNISNKEILVVVYDMQGKETYSKIVVTGQNEELLQAIDPSNKLAKGVYFITATSDNIYFRQKVVIE